MKVFKDNSRKGMGPGKMIGIVISLVIVAAIFLVVIPEITSASNSAKDAALSCPGWKSKWADRTGGGVELC